MDYDLWQKFITGAANAAMGVTKPFRLGANILGQNWGSALTGKDMSERENQGQFLRWLSSGITPEEQQAIEEKPYLEALKSGAGMAATLAPFSSNSIRTAQLVADPLKNRILQLAGQGALEGGMGGFGYADPGDELRDAAIGTIAGPVAEIGIDYLLNPQFRGLLNDQIKSQLPPYRNLPSGPALKEAGMSYQDLLSDKSRPILNKDFSPEAESIADSFSQRWGSLDKFPETILAKIEQGGDKALNAESEWIMQVFNNMNPPTQVEALNRIDEIINLIQDPGQRQQVELLRKYLVPKDVLGASVEPIINDYSNPSEIVPITSLNPPREPNFDSFAEYIDSNDLRRATNLLNLSVDESKKIPGRLKTPKKNRALSEVAKRLREEGYW